MFSIAKVTRTAVFAGILSLSAVIGGANLAQAVDEVNINDGYAVHGYDMVAYFTDGAPTEGVDEFTAEYDGATYRFASAANRDSFADNPSKYAPQYGGYCAYGAAVGRKFDIDPDAWNIVDGKLYLNKNKRVQQRWLENPEGYIRGADFNWPQIVSLSDDDLESNPPSGLAQGIK